MEEYTENFPLIESKITEDGSHTLYSPQFKQHYHSVFGAMQESKCVFIELGLAYVLEKIQGEISVFEMGFGTGLNALMTCQAAEQQQRKIGYTAIENYPISLEKAQQLNYDELIQSKDFLKLHKSEWDTQVPVNQYFSLEKIKGKLEEFESEQFFDLIYFDAFAPESQPELWTQEIFEKMIAMLNTGGVLTTYCSKGYVQRNMKAAGFTVEKHQGPPHKREIIRAIKV